MVRSVAINAPFGSARHHDSFKVDHRRMAEEKAFSSILTDALRESVRAALGADVLQILVTKGLLDNSDNPVEFGRQLQSLFGNGARVLERLVVKELYHKLSIPYHSESSFDYAESLENAKEMCFVKARVK